MNLSSNVPLDVAGRRRKEMFTVILLYFAICGLFLAFFLGRHLYQDSKGFAPLNYLNFKYARLYHQPAFWVSELSGGDSYIGNSDNAFFDIAWLVSLFIPDLGYNVNIAIVIYLFLSMLGTFLLVRYITNNVNAAFVAGLFIISSGFFVNMLGLMTFTNSMAFMPFVIFFLLKAVDNKDAQWLNSSIYAGIFLSFFILAAGASDLLWFSVIVFPLLYALKLILGSINPQRMLRITIVFAVLLLIGIALSSVRLLPTKEYLAKGGSRAIKQTYDNFVWYKGINRLLGKSLLQNFTIKDSSIRLGVTALLIIAGGIFLSIRRLRLSYYFIFALLGAILALMIASDTFVTKMVYALPVISSLRGVEKGLSVLPFFYAMLLGISYDMLSKYKCIFNKKYVVAVVSILLLVEMVYVFPFPKERIDMWKQIKDSSIISKLNELSSSGSDELFRVHRMGDSFVGSTCYRLLPNVHLYASGWCGSHAWFNNYVEFTMLAENNNGVQPVQDVPPYFAKMRAILNDKYFISNVNLTGKGVGGSDIASLIFIGNYSDEPTADMGVASYIYENAEFLPRFYIADKAILLFGKIDAGRGALYSLIRQDYFDPHKAIIVLADGSKPLSPEAFDLIILLDDSFKSNPSLLEFISNNPSRVFPSPYYSEGDVSKAVKEVNGSIIPVTVGYYSPNKITLTIPEGINKGHLVMSEKFFQYDTDWSVLLGKDRMNMQNTYNVISSFYFDNPSSRNVSMSYLPRPLVIGGIISISAWIVCILVLFRNRLPLHKQEDNAKKENEAKANSSLDPS